MPLPCLPCESASPFAVKANRFVGAAVPLVSPPLPKFADAGVCTEPRAALAGREFDGVTERFAGAGDIGRDLPGVGGREPAAPLPAGVFLGVAARAATGCFAGTILPTRGEGP